MKRLFSILLGTLFLSTTLIASEAGERTKGSSGPPMITWQAPAFYKAPSSGRTALTDAAPPMPYIPLVPCRQYSSLSATPLADNTPRTVTLSGAPCGISTTAKAVAVNITVFNIVASANAVFKVDTVSPPATAWINYPPTEAQRGNAGVVSLDGSGAIIVQVNQGGGSVDFVVDVFGYYGPTPAAPNTFTVISPTNATGILGESLGGGIGVYGYSLGTGGRGVFGYNNSATGQGVNGSAPSGFGVYGTSNSNVGVKGVSGTYNGVWAESTNQDGLFASGGRDGAYITGARHGAIAVSQGNGTVRYGVLGGGASSTSGSAGGYFYDYSGGPAGVGSSFFTTAGVIGVSKSIGVLGIVGNNYAGVGGVSLSDTTPFAQQSAGWLGWSNATAGFFSGNVTITSSAGGAGNLSVGGTLSKGAGSFKIDHPLDPENKYLYHSFVESPDMMNIYNGIIELDALGEAIVQLPAYFEALNSDFRYQLTSIGRGQPSLYIADEVQDLKFRIAGGKPHARVSWQVTGIRKDAFANANRIISEVEKEPAAKGYYLHPSAYKQPAEKSLIDHLAVTQKAEAEEQAKSQQNR